MVLCNLNESELIQALGYQRFRLKANTWIVEFNTISYVTILDIISSILLLVCSLAILSFALSIYHFFPRSPIPDMT